jgi:hypothetical protein
MLRPKIDSLGAPSRLDRIALTRLSRAGFLRRSAVAVGGLTALGALGSGAAFASSGADPVPIPGGFDIYFNPVTANPFIHVLPPAVGFEMATISNFNGVVGAAEMQGTANGGAYNFDCDMRFMQGLYAGVDDRLRHGTFGFI